MIEMCPVDAGSAVGIRGGWVMLVALSRTQKTESLA